LTAKTIEGGRNWPQYILRAPFSLQKMRYQPTSRTVIYRSKMHRVLKRNFEVFPVLDWIAAVTAHIPNKGEHLVRYYGWYSNVNRGKRKQAEEHTPDAAPDGIVEIAPPPGSALFKERWARFIKKVYEADPLLCRKSSPTWGCGPTPPMPRLTAPWPSRLSPRVLQAPCSSH
jgi:hypothetical protein